MIDRMAESFSFHLRKRVKERIVVIESDDWGLQRARQAEALDWVAHKYGKDKFSRWTTDAMESAEDMNALFDVLSHYQNKFEKPPIFTTNFITHNADIDATGNLTFRSLSESTATIREIYMTGISARYIYPQFHGFSHFNTSSLADYVLTDDAREDHENGFLLAKSTIRGSLNFLHGEFSKENPNLIKDFEAGLLEFRNYFGFSSLSVIPPTFVFDTNWLTLLKQNGIKYLQAGNRLRNSNNSRCYYPLLRKKNGIIWGIRNARLDPHPQYKFGFEECLANIDLAFTYQLPAVIDLHRVNISGRYPSSYRELTLWHLNKLLKAILKRWPDTQFLTTVELMKKIDGAS